MRRQLATHNFYIFTKNGHTMYALNLKFSTSELLNELHTY